MRNATGDRSGKRGGTWNSAVAGLCILLESVAHAHEAAMRRP